MKIKVTIVLGFLESGKTTLINSMLKNNDYTDEILVIIQDEIGCSKLDTNLFQDSHCEIITLNTTSQDKFVFDENSLNKITEQYSPHEIIIEANGIKNPQYIFSVFNNNIYKIDNIITLLDASKFKLYFNNLKDILTDSIFYADTIIVNNLEKLNKKDFAVLKKDIRTINETASIFQYNDFFNDGNVEEYINIEQNNFSFIKNLFLISIFLFLFTFITTISVMNINMPAYLDVFQKFKITFISLIIESFPFILLASIISSIIQIYISEDTLFKIFPKNTFLSCIIAALLGFIVPICDCGTIPIVKSMINKKIPIGAAVTFMLAAPIINPVSIISTIYAFQNDKSVAGYRIFYGIVISILVGLIMNFFYKNKNSIVLNNDINCTCNLCINKSWLKKGRIKNLIAASIHTVNEFFNVSKYMIVGAFLSSIFQNIIPLNNTYIPNDNISSLIFMMLLSFVLSVCSTSDAFIARSFLNSFSLNSVMGFLVAGPMLDIKNTIMLFGNFKKQFVLRLIFFIFIISFSVLIIFRF